MRPPATPSFGARSNKVSYDLAFSAIIVANFKKLFSSRVKAVCGDNRWGGGRRVSTAYASTNVPELPRSSWHARRAASRFHLQRTHDAHATNIRPQSCSLYPEEKRAPCLSGITRAFLAQYFSGSLHCIHRKTRSIFSGNSYKQSTFPFELDL